MDRHLAKEISMTQTQLAVGPVRPAAGHTALRPAIAAQITGGLWEERRRINREISIPGGWDRLQEAGNFHNLELAAGRATGEYVNDLPFLDSDVYKWLEAVGWVFADPDLDQSLKERLLEHLAATERLLRAAQQPDGYLNSYFQVHFPGERFVQLQWGHELYCAGHLIQAAVALHRTTGQTGLLEVACRVADRIVAAFGVQPGQIDGVCGHPEIESALVELYRETGDDRYLNQARYFIDRRGHGLLGNGHFGRHYWQDHLPLREAPSAEGHAVRELYLLAGAADLYVETGDETLLVALKRIWAEMVATKTYLTGGIGAHHKDESFGDPYELPHERSYCETCAAISSIMFSWRMLMITGEAKYADLIERTLYNGFLAGVSLDGQRYIYANPLQVREGHVSRGNDGDYKRVSWFRCACCPPNVMRTLASLEHYVLLGSPTRAVLHQYMTGQFTAELAEGEVVLEVTTDYPWDGTVTVLIASAPDRPWELALRVPDWAERPSLTVNGGESGSSPADGWWTVQREWHEGDEVVLVLPLQPRFTTADPRVDAARGTVALEYGPLVYCLEAVDNPGHRLDDITIDTGMTPKVVPGDGLLADVATIRTTGQVRARPNSSWWWPYRPAGRAPETGEPTTLNAVPYYTWGNREQGAMRIWVPTNHST
jgi:uncharacterized protein